MNSRARIIVLDGGTGSKQLPRSLKPVHFARYEPTPPLAPPTSQEPLVLSELSRPIKALIEAAEQVEWRDALQSGTYQRSASEEDERVYEASRMRHPRDLLPHPPSPDAQQKNLHDAFARVTKLAREIRETPTIFCLAIEKDVHEDKNFLALCKAFAEELTVDSSLTSDSRISFTRLNNSGKLPENYQVLMSHLLSRMTAPRIENSGIDREGPILIVGETGAGKTELARSIHQTLQRKGNFIAVNVAATDPGLLESRIRGFVKGTFTDAKEDRAGWFQEANNGTLFLDEFQSAPIEIQLQLLDLMRAVSDTVEVSKIGDESNKGKFNVKLILATNESISSLLAKGGLRNDLFFRIRQKIELDPLRDRLRKEPHLLTKLLSLYRWRSNIPLLNAGDVDIARKISLVPSFGDNVLEMLNQYAWPGNLREIERACFDVYWEHDRSGGQISDFLEPFRRTLNFNQSAGIGTGASSSSRPIDRAVYVRLQEAERILIKNNFNVSKSKEELGGIKLKSPQALKEFLRRHQEHLTSEIWKDSRARNLLIDKKSVAKPQVKYLNSTNGKASSLLE